MSHIIVHDVSAIARRRIGRRHQVAALITPPRGPVPDLYGLNRPPFDHLLPPWGVPEELELPKDELAAAAAAAGAPRAPSAARPLAAGAGRAGASTCAQRTYVLRLFFAAGAAGELRAVSSSVLPVPCVIAGLDTFGPHDDALKERFWGLSIVNTDIAGALPEPTGTPLMETNTNLDPGAAELANFHPRTPIRWPSSGTISEATPIATAMIGDVITEPGARLCFMMRGTVDATVGATIIATVRQLACDNAMEFRSVAPRTAARAAPTPSAAAAAAPAPARIRPSYGPDPSVGLLAPRTSRTATPGKFGFARERPEQNFYTMYNWRF